MIPRVQYTTTAGGVRLAYAVAGSGPNLLRVHGVLWDHGTGYWRLSVARRQLERLARSFTHIQHDARGVGLSQGSEADFRLAAQLEDIEAVVLHEGLESFALLGQTTGGPAAIAYAAMHPERVSRLILFSPHLRGADYFGSLPIRALEGYRRMAEEDWSGYRQTLAMRVLSFSDRDSVRELAAVYAESMTPTLLHQFEEQYRAIDATEFASRIVAPTLLIVPQARTPAVGRGWQEVAALIPNAETAFVRADLPLPFLDAATDAIEEFLLGHRATRSADVESEGQKPGLQVIVFTDIEDHGAMMQRLGDSAGRKVLRDHERITRDLLAAHGGSEVKSLGDGFLTSFSSAQRALEYAIALQRAFDDYNRSAKAAVRVRVGINAGEPISENEDLFGASVILAARTAAKAQGGEVLLTDVVRQLAMGKGFLFSDRGETEMRGFEDPVRLFELKW